MIKKIVDYFRHNPPKIDLNLISYDDILNGITVKDGIKEKTGLPRLDVMRYEYEDDTWIVFRPSGTEPKLKVYFGTKKKTIEEAKNDLQQLDQKIFMEINKIKEML